MVCHLIFNLLYTKNLSSGLKVLRSYFPFKLSRILSKAPDISIELAGDRPNVPLQLKILADVEKKYTTKHSGERTILRTSDERMCAILPVIAVISAQYFVSPCDEARELVIELYERANKLEVWKRKKQLLTMRVPLEGDKLYTDMTYPSKYIVTILLAIDNNFHC